MGRDTHHRAKEVVNHLCHLGWTVWFDDTDMDRHNIDGGMARGIDECSTVVLLITHAYARKINRAARKQHMSNDNCLKEFAYTMFREKKIVPVVFEDSMKDPSQWSPGMLPFRLGMSLYVDGTGSGWRTAHKIHTALIRDGEYPHNARSRTMTTSRSDSSLRNSAPLRRAPRLSTPDDTKSNVDILSSKTTTRVCAI